MNLKKITELDSDFSEAKFLSYIANVFVQIHTAIMTKQLEKVKHFMNQDMYMYFKQKIDDLNQKKLTQMYDELNVKETHLLNENIVDGMMQIKVLIVARYVDYRMDENGKVVDGISDRRIMKNYYLTFQKPILHKDAKEIHKCPNCGASININGNGRCEYCHSIYNLSNESWILISMVTE